MAEHKQETAAEKIDLTRLLRNYMRVLRRWWFLIPVLAALLGGLRYFQVQRNFQPLYTASATFSVTSGLGDTTDILSGSSYYDSQAVQQVVDSFPYIIGSEAMTERIRMSLGTDAVNGTVNPPKAIGANFYVLSATSPDPQRALDLLNAVIENYPQVASFVVGGARLSILEEPSLPQTPSNSFSGRNAAVKGAVLGAVLCCGVLFLVSLGRSTVEGPEDLRRDLSLPCLGILPQARTHRRRKAEAKGVSLQNEGVKRQLADPFSSLRVKLLRELERDGSRMLLVTSTVPGEGKTTVAYNLALSLAQSGRSVILVDGDLRNQCVKERFGLKGKSKGLAELLREKEPDIAAALQDVGGTGLRVLAGQTRISRAMDLVDSRNMSRLLDQLRQLADYVIVDAPPAGILGDAAVLGRYTDRTLYVVRCDGVPRRQVVDGILGLIRRNVTLCGFVLNGSQVRPVSGYGYGKYGKSGYGRYGYGYGRSHRA